MPMTSVEVLRAACCVAGLDGEFDEREVALLRRLAEKAGVGAVSLKAMMDRAASDPNFYQEQFHYISADPRSAMTQIIAVAVADGHLAPDERIILHHFAERLALDERSFDKLLRAAENYTQRRARQGDTQSDDPPKPE